jgi:uncharacterized protein YfaS (alpha-2-macroglobulin family)
LSFTPAQLATVHLATTHGHVLVTSSWEGPLDASSLQTPSGATFERTVTPAGPIAADQLVTVDLTVVLAPDADLGCWGVTDPVPSGLAPLAAGKIWPQYEEDDATPPDAEGPWRISGQRVEFCVSRDSRGPVHHLRYVARVITPGTYRWEPAVLQSGTVLEQGIVLPAFDLVVNGGS